MTANAQFAAKMAELSAAFTRRTAEDADEFEALAAALSKNDDSAHRSRIQYLAHRLSGGSSTFGLVTLEAPAYELESSILAEASVEQVCERTRELVSAIRLTCEQSLETAGGNDVAP